MTTPKFSVIICSIEAAKFARVSERYKTLLAGHPFEIIGIHDARSLAEGYNRGIDQSDGDILVFSHDDVLILDSGFADKIVDRLARFDLLGFVGTSHLINATWFGAGLPHLHGVVAHAKPRQTQLQIDIVSVDGWPVIPGIKAVDGLCFITTRTLAETVRFDAEHFDGFHLYDIDFSFSAHLAGYRLAVCCDIPIIHESAGQFDQKHSRYAEIFMDKYQSQLDAHDGRPRPSTPTWRGALFKDPPALVRAWQRDLLQRSTLAAWRRTGVDAQPSPF